MSTEEIRVPDLGDFDEVDVVEVYVRAGDTVAAEDPLIGLETDKAAMDVPSPKGGRIASVRVEAGDKVAAGDVIATLEAAADEREATGRVEPTAAPAPEPEPEPERGGTAAAPAPSSRPAPVNVAADESPGAGAPGPRLVVIGAGPGGYTAAFRAADLGLDVTLVDRWPSLGGVCLNVGCIPSKALLHAARVIEETKEAGAFGIKFPAPEIDVEALRDWKTRVVKQLTNGLEGLAKQRKVDVVRGEARLIGAHTVRVERDGGHDDIDFDQCIVAAGSEPTRIPGVPEDPRIMDSTGALELEDLPERMLVVGGGIIGLEMATVYDALGVKVSIVELTKTLIPGCDRDLVRPLQKRIAQRYESIMLGTRVSRIEAGADGVTVHFEGDEAPEAPQLYGRVLVAVGRRPNGAAVGCEAAGVGVDEHGYIAVDKQMRTNVPHIFAIGDIVGPPMLAHKATHEGKVAAEVAAGHKSHFDARVVPAVAYTDPEIAWVGLTEEQAKADGIAYRKGTFPWAASGRSLSLGRSDGLTKLLFDESTGHLLGAGIAGTSAGDLIAEAALAIEFGADAADIGLTVHPHPTLSETVAFAAEMAEGTITDLYVPRR